MRIPRWLKAVFLCLLAGHLSGWLSLLALTAICGLFDFTPSAWERGWTFIWFGYSLAAAATVIWTAVWAYERGALND